MENGKEKVELEKDKNGMGGEWRVKNRGSYLI